MSLLSPRIEGYIERSSWIRKMFETGAELKKKLGADNVFDFSLGNPDLPPPPGVKAALQDIVAKADAPLAFGYVPNAGLPAARSALADHLSTEQKAPLTAANVIVTCGAAGALNTFFHAVLEPGDEVVCPAPYFVEYGFYAANHGGALVVAASTEFTFELDVAAIEAVITPKTRAVLVNSPNNPSGQIYTAEQLASLADLLRAKSAEHGRPIFLLSDEPYRFLTYDNVEVPPILPLYEHSVVMGSFSKSLSLAGERVGYIALNPGMTGGDTLLAGLVLCNRILGFVNAPVIGQIIVTEALRDGVDVSVYDDRRRSMAAILDDVGIDYTMPKGAFYFFPKAPGGDDLAFVNQLLAENILAVPGRGFGCPGYFRLTFCMDKAIIERSHDAFARAMKS
ncbi:MAG: pyridoxal phosphate-dependent aminotransferase [Lentisphaeria bacterium]|nr:pyridoxal phosphate-dependent aminotransferase [Lentisphaeria bacterium]